MRWVVIIFEILTVILILFKDSVLAARAKYDSRLFPITVSQDCGHEATLDVIRHYSKSNPDLNYIEQLDRSEPWQVKRNFLGYYKLSRHYKFALSKVFELFPNADGVIIIEGLIHFLYFE